MASRGVESDVPFFFDRKNRIIKTREALRAKYQAVAEDKGARELPITKITIASNDKTFDVPEMVNDVATVIQPLAEKKGNTLQIHCESDAASMRADLTKVRQTLFNLLSNASKFTQGGAISLDVIRQGGSQFRGTEF